jgi:hypothetical protein
MILHLAPCARPRLHLTSQPESRSPAAPIQHRTRHVGIPALVQVDRVRLGEAQNGRYVMGIHQVIYIDVAAHAWSLEDTAPL